MNNNNTFNQDWEQCFSQYRVLSSAYQQILRSIATKQLIDSKFEEIGSSDINFTLFNLWKSGNKNWNDSLMNAFNEFSFAN